MTRLALVLLLIGSGTVYADNTGIHYEHYQGRDWRGETFRQGTVEDTTVLGPGGRQRHCHSYIPGGAQGNPSDRVTECN
jgi:hypothetical protein